MRSHIWKIAGNVFRREKFKSFLMGAMIISSVIFALIPPLVLERIVDRLTDKKNVGAELAIIYLSVIVLSGLMESVQNIMITVMGQKVTHEIRSVMSRKLMNLNTSYFTANDMGKTQSRFVNDVDAVDTLFTNGIIGMFADAFKVISIMIVIFIKSTGLGVIMCIVTPLLFVMTMVFQRRMQRAQMLNREAVAKVNHHVVETINNIRSIHIFSGEKYMENKYDKYIDDGYRAIDKSNFYDAIYSPIVICVSSVVIAVMMVFSAIGNEVQSLFMVSVGSAVAIIAYVLKVFEPLENIGMEIQNIQSALAGVKRIDEYLSEDELNKVEKIDVKKMVEGNKLDIEFDKITFGYEDGKIVLSDFSLHIGPGENILFAGRTGAGKSTIFKLLLGLYEPLQGSITINGIRCDSLKGIERRKVFGYVEQNFNIVEGNIRNQISLFDNNISDEEIWKSLELCGISEKIRSFEAGLEASMNASDFSQGELKLLSIARAMVTNPQIMLLDEITADLDSVTEKRILDVLHIATEGRTVISISHRMKEQMRNTRVINI